MKINGIVILRFCLFSFILISGALLGLTSFTWALDPQHQVAGSYGGTRLYAHDSIVISPRGAINLYSQTTTGFSTLSSNAGHKDSFCRSVINKSNNDYFVPWRTAVTGPITGSTASGVNEWTAFLDAVNAGTVEGVETGLCCYPRINPNKPCGSEYHLGKRDAGALPSLNPNPADTSINVAHYGAVGDISNDVITGYNRRETWMCDTAGEWVNTDINGGCYRDGQCNTYDPATNPSGYHGASVSSIPSSNAERASRMCNGVIPVAVMGGASAYPNPESGASVPPYGTGGWKWMCPGQDGGSSEICSASYNNSPMDGLCGPANGKATGASPATPQLCFIGTPNIPNFNSSLGKWTWVCAGVNGGQTASCSANSANVASCGTYSWQGRSSGLLGFEVVDGKPDPQYLCTVGVLSGDVAGDGTTTAPWSWKCYQEANNTYATCSNSYEKQGGKCGAANDVALPVEPTVSAVTCAAGRWYNKVPLETIVGLQAKDTLWNASTQKWTWACLGYNQATGTPINDLCEATLCHSCEGTSSEVKTESFSGDYDNCSLAGADASIQLTATIKRQTNSSDVAIPFSFGNGHGHGQVAFKTTVADGYCSPCYNKVVAISNATVTVNSSCVLSPPRTYSATP